MKPLPTDIVFLAAKRTPFGTYGGSLKDVSATDLAVHAAKAALAQSKVAPEDVDNVVFGNVLQTSADAIYLARHVGLRAGLPQHVPALTVNRLCGSGFSAVVDAAIELPGKKGQTINFGRDEHNRPDTTVETLAKLPKVFKKDGVIHAGAASGICDGAGALVIATRQFADKRGLKPLGKLLGWGISGCDPSIMGIGPAPAVRKAFERHDATLKDFDLFEVNEAFAPQYLAVEKDLGLPRENTNVDGGAIAVGHPLAASGARITAH